MTVSTVQEIKQAAAKLSRKEQTELLHWLTESHQAVAQSETADWLARWTALNARVNAAVGAVTWTRDDLHAR